MTLRIGIVGLGNCASALVQGVHYYANQPDSSAAPGLVRPVIGGYKVSDIEFAVAYDVDLRKIGWSIKQAIFNGTNCCMNLSPNVVLDESGRFDGPVLEAPILDGVAPHMRAADPSDKERFFTNTTSVGADVMHHAESLKTHRVDVLVNYLPVGSQLATEYWAQVCLMARVPMVNCIPVFIASNVEWSERFRANKVAIIGDDMKSQFGASVLSQAIQELAEARGHGVKVHIQQNSGGNTDFLNMADHSRLASKKISKENVIRDHGSAPGYLHAGPSDYIRAFGDKKVAHFRVELEGFCGSPVILDARLEVQDSPNSAGVVIDAVRYVRTAQNNGIYGALEGPSAFTQKSPPVAMTMADAIEACNNIANL